jgi:hypothetical protein
MSIVHIRLRMIWCFTIIRSGFNMFIKYSGFLKEMFFKTKCQKSSLEFSKIKTNNRSETYL